MQVDALFDFARCPFVFGVHVEVAEFLAAEFFEMKPLFQRVLFEFLQGALHIGDRLPDIAVGFGGDRRVVDGESRQELPFDQFFGGETSRFLLFEFLQRAVDRFGRIGDDHLFPEPENPERCAEQGIAAFGKEAVGEFDAGQGPLRILVGECGYQHIERIHAAVGVTGLVGFGERLFPIAGGEHDAVGVQVGQLDVYLFPFGGGARAGQCCQQTVGCRGCGMRRQSGADCQECDPGKGLRDNRTHVGSVTLMKNSGQI